MHIANYFTIKYIICLFYLVIATFSFPQAPIRVAEGFQHGGAAPPIERDSHLQLKYYIVQLERKPPPRLWLERHLAETAAQNFQSAKPF
jgi:hypothetical protein